VVPSRATDRFTLRRRFRDLVEAKKFASDTYEGAGKMGTDFFASSAEERAAFAAIIPELRRRGISFKDVLMVGVIQAVTVRKTVDEVVAELLELKRQRWEAWDLRDRSYSDFTQRMSRIALHFRRKYVAEVTEHDVKAWAKGLKLGRRTVKNFVNVCSRTGAPSEPLGELCCEGVGLGEEMVLGRGRGQAPGRAGLFTTSPPCSPRRCHLLGIIIEIPGGFS
jgi:hypothetical protein